MNSKVLIYTLLIFSIVLFFWYPDNIMVLAGPNGKTIYVIKDRPKKSKDCPVIIVKHRKPVKITDIHLKC
ncbi:hypothetical protein ALC57_04618 [Trachymyrmex cornetzi]|uniref:Uncharacterized protein n=1 Tax=Trachymyrmex cornetzi TaxID=471704 RepID=A0A195ECK0_9HYME|nr:hypothetical protein ALC57_04618 [Trachymyrmex cornetzi]